MQTVFCYHYSGTKVFKDKASHTHTEPALTSLSCSLTPPIFSVLLTEVVFPPICQRNTSCEHSLIFFRQSQEVCCGQQLELLKTDTQLCLGLFW